VMLTKLPAARVHRVGINPSGSQPEPGVTR
jgi:hypothetical protein